VLLGGAVATAAVIAIGIAAPDRPSASSRSAAAVGAAASADAPVVLVRGGFAAALDQRSILDRPGLHDASADFMAGPPAGRMEAAGDVGPPPGPADLAVRVVAAEGGPGRSSTSSAAGYGQFLRTTWLDVFGRAYPDIARMLNSDQILALRYVKPLALDLTSRYARENAATLVRVGLPATDTALSLAHAVGAGGAMTILTAPPRVPVADLLSPQAIAANPVFGRMTADDLQGWAANRIGTSAAPQPSEPAAEPVPTLEPGEDFRVDKKTMASEVLRTNRAMIGRLREVTQSPAPVRGLAPAQPSPSPPKAPLADRRALLTAGEPAAAALLDAIDAVSHRSGYGQFQMLARRARETGRLPAELVRDLTLVLIGKMEEENATILGIAQHRRGAFHGATHAPVRVGRS
jgi:hypothetical protein